MVPYFQQTIDLLKNFLTPNKTGDDQEDKLRLQVQAIGTDFLFLCNEHVKQQISCIIYIIH